MLLGSLQGVQNAKRKGQPQRTVSEIPPDQVGRDWAKIWADDLKSRLGAS